MEAKLIVIGGKANKSEVKLKLPTIIGRSRSADLTVAHPKVSRHHCQILERDGLLYVRDNGSLNGTFIDNARITEGILKPGDKLTVGPLTFVAVYEPGVAGSKEPAGAVATPANAPSPASKTKTGKTTPGAANVPGTSSVAAPAPIPKAVPKPAVPAAAKTQVAKPSKDPAPTGGRDESFLADLEPDEDSIAAAKSLSQALPSDDSPKAKAGGRIEWLPDVQSAQSGKGGDPAADTVDFSWLPKGGQDQESNLPRSPALNLSSPAKTPGAGQSPPAKATAAKKKESSADDFSWLNDEPAAASAKADDERAPWPPSPPGMKQSKADEPPATADFNPVVNAGMLRDVAQEPEEPLNWLEEDQPGRGIAQDGFEVGTPQTPNDDQSPHLNATATIPRDELAADKAKESWFSFGGKAKRPAADGATAQFASPLQDRERGFVLGNGVETPQPHDSAESPSVALRNAVAAGGAGQATSRASQDEDDDLSAFFKTLED